ncbi:MAG: SPASM domain-containing protein [Armatimonadota bacterium]
MPAPDRTPRQVQTDIGEVVYDETSGSWRPIGGDAERGAAAIGAPGQALSAPVDIAPWPRARYADAVPTVVLNTHRSCELHCRYCFAHPAAEDYSLPPMSMAVAERAVDFLCTDLGKEAPTVVVRSTLLGEPRMDLAFTDAIAALIRTKEERYSKKIEWHWGQTTNLAKLPSDEVLRRLPWVTVSIDGPPDVHDAMRQFPDGTGSYALVARNLRALMTNEVNPLGPPVGASATLTAAHPDVTRVFLHLYHLGFTRISINPVRLPPGSFGAIDEQSVGAVQAGYSQFADFLLAQDSDRLLSYLQPIYHPYDFFGRFFVRSLDPGKLPYRCEAGKWSVSVDPDGTIYPCPSFAAMRACRMGSVFEGIEPAAHQFWAEELFIENRGSCRSCGARGICGGGCYHQALLATGRPDHPCPALCELTRHLTEIGAHVVGELRAKRRDVLDALPEPHPSASPARPQVSCTRVESAGPGGHDLSGWESQHPLWLADRRLIQWKRWGGPSDLSAEVHLGWDRLYLYVRVRVCDEVFVPPSRDARFRTGDSFKMSLFPLPSPLLRYGFWCGQVAGASQLVAYEEGLADGAVPKAVRSTARCNVYREDSHTEYQLALPWAEMDALRPGEDFGVCLQISDDNGRSRGELAWPASSPYGLAKCLPGSGHSRR